MPACGHWAVPIYYASGSSGLVPDVPEAVLFVTFFEKGYFHIPSYILVIQFRITNRAFSRFPALIGVNTIRNGNLDYCATFGACFFYCS